MPLLSRDHNGNRFRLSYRCHLLAVLSTNFTQRQPHSSAATLLSSYARQASNLSQARSLRSLINLVSTSFCKQVTSIARSFAIVFWVDRYAILHKNTNLPTVDGDGLQVLERTAACRAINGIETARCIFDLDRIRSGRRRNGAVSRRKHTIAVSSCGALVFCSGIAFTKVRNVYRL